MTESGGTTKITHRAVSFEDAEALRETLIDLERANVRESEARAESDAILAGLNVLSEPRNRERVFEKLIEVLKGIIGFEEALILTLDGGGGLQPVISTKAELADSVWTVGDMMQRVLSGKAAACFDISAIPEWREQPESIRAPFSSALHVLLRHDPVPALFVCLHSQRGFFSAKHILRAMRLAPLVSQALFNIDYTRRIERMAEQLRNQALALKQEMDERQKTALQLEESLRRSEEQKQHFFESSESNSALVSLLTHDVANPLTGLLGILSLLEHRFQGADHEYFLRMFSCASDIQAIVENVRLLRATANGKISLRLTPVDLIEYLDRTIAVLKGRLQEKGIELVKTYELTSGSAIRVTAEPVSLQFSVLQNILSNAIKFSHPGSRIVVSIEPCAGRVLLIVRDHGVGIPSAMLPHLFEPATVTTRAGTRGERGTGFGLPLVKMFVERYGGSIAISSRESGDDAGTQVVLNLPLAQRAKETP